MVLTIVAAAVVARAPFAAGQAVSHEQVDKIFARWNGETPGCAVGVGVKGRPALEKAYGMADLEHGVANKPDTIFEAGSVSKQFTAAAIALLALDGTLGLDDDVRRFVPELPDWALDQHTLQGKAMGRGLAHFREEGAKLVPEPTEPDPYIEEAYRLWTLKQERGRRR